jgi:hypothetical protein
LAPPLNRREVIAASATALILDSDVARSALIKGQLPFRPGGTNPPESAEPGPWRFFTPEEGTTVDAIVDRLIPADAPPEARISAAPSSSIASSPALTGISVGFT